MIYYSAATGSFYDDGIHKHMPKDVIEISQEQHAQLLQGQSDGMVISSINGQPVLQPKAPLNVDQLSKQIDTAADAARAAVVGDPLRAVEYERAASEAQSFAAANYQGDVPPMVAAWAISGRTTQQAAEDILREAAQYDGAIVQLRTLRLEAKELIRAAMSEGNAELAENIAAEAITAIEAAVAGIGNNI